MEGHRAKLASLALDLTPICVGIKKFSSALARSDGQDERLHQELGAMSNKCFSNLQAHVFQQVEFSELSLLAVHQLLLSMLTTNAGMGRNNPL